MTLVRNFKCNVPGCNVPQADLPGLKIHRFPSPKEKARREKWLQFCLFDSESDPGGQMNICSVHFPVEAYQPQYQLLGRDRKDWRLNLDAVPTLYPPPDFVPEEFTEIIEEIDPTEYEVSIIEEEEVEEIVEDVILSHQCRLCLDMVDPDDPTVNLFDTPVGGNSLSGDILVMFHLIIEESPMWPTIACYKCVQFMHQIKEFKKQIMASHRTLYKEIVQDKDIEETVEVQEETVEVQEDDLPEALQSMGNNDNSGDANESEDMEVECNSEAEKDEEAEEATGEDYWKYLKKKYSLGKRTIQPRNPEREKELEKKMIELKWLFCGECSQDDFETLQDLSDHMHSEHELAKGYIVCCQTKFGIGKSVYDHMEYHLDADKFKCVSCDKQFMSGALLGYHNHRYHSTEYKCKTCGKVAHSRYKLRNHEATHLPTELRPFKCGYCPKAFANPGNCKRHVERMHEIEERHVCEYCGKKFSNRGTYWQHVKDHERAGKPSAGQSEEKGSECPVCGRNYVALQQHLEKAHGSRTEATPDEQELKECIYCSELVQRVRMAGHLRKVHNRTFMECRPCNKQFKSTSQYQEHKDKHMNVIFKCDYCEKINNTGQGKSLHMKTHHPEEYKLRVESTRRVRGVRALNQ